MFNALTQEYSVTATFFQMAGGGGKGVDVVLI